MKKIKYEVKLELSVKLILFVLTIGVVLNALMSPVAMELFGIKDANAAQFMEVIILNWPTKFF
tara:strand:+ start:600 stop:788 length:189 start_codon:yes stop_codon:yes gene_type:complete